MGPDQLASLSTKSRGDVRLLMRAAREGWDVPNRLRSKAAIRLGVTAADDRNSDTVRLQAVRGVLTFQRANIQADRLDRAEAAKLAAGPKGGDDV